MQIAIKVSMFAFFLLFGSLLNAQADPAKKSETLTVTPMNAEAQAAKQDEAMEKELNLSKEQKEQFKKINQAHKEKAKAARKERKEDMKKMHDERVAAHKAVLTKEQARKYDEMLAKREAKREDKKDAKKSERKAAKKQVKPGRAPKATGGQ
jgi:Spy/CpxP family protein refolding chaperone